jgi:hypothetical protein
VKTIVDTRLRDEAKHFAFRYACEDCIHFCRGGAAQPTGQACSLAYPASPRRGALEAPSVEFCKSFEVA